MTHRNSRNGSGYRPRHAAPGRPRREKVLDRAEKVKIIAGAIGAVATAVGRVVRLVQRASQWLG